MKTTELTPEYFYNLALEDYQKTLSDMLSKKQNIPRAVKVYLLFPVLKKHNINSWEQLQEAMVLIDEKQSTLPAIAREVVVHLYTHCMFECAKAFKKNLIDV